MDHSYILSLFVALVFWLDLIHIHQPTSNEKDLEILFLRQQLALARRRQKRGPAITFMEKLVLVALVHKLRISEQSSASSLIV